MSAAGSAEEDAAQANARASQYADEVVASTAGAIFTAGSAYKQRLLRRLLVTAFLAGTIEGAGVATRRAVEAFEGGRQDGPEVESSFEVHQREVVDLAERTGVALERHRAPTEPGRNSDEVDVEVVDDPDASK